MSQGFQSKETVRTFNRFELKYLLHYKQARRFEEIIGAHVESDQHAGPGGFYKIASLYYDSRDLKCYWEKIDGEKYRRKIRVRTYGTHPDKAFVEIKQRYNLNVQKRRLIAPIDEVEEQMAKIQSGSYEGGVHPVYDEVFYLVQRERLEPKVIISYNRAAFFDRHHRDLRITLDRNLRCRHLDLDLRSQRHRGKFAIPPQYLVLEVKFNHAMPRWLCTALNCLDLQIQRISKYCYGVESLGMEPWQPKHDAVIPRREAAVDADAVHPLPDEPVPPPTEASRETH